MHTEERLHALDAVRAFALLAGIVLHAAMTFMPGLAAIGFPADSSPSTSLEIAFYVIHVFRMALFFFIAGFFGRLMLHRKGTKKFLRDRAMRIGVPFLVGWVFFGPLAIGIVFIALAPNTGTPPAPQSGLPLAHLWFLYYLGIFYAAVLSIRAAIAKLDREGTFRARIDVGVRSSVRFHIAPVVVAAPLALCLYLTPNWVLWSGIQTPDMGLLPKLPASIGFGTAVVFGWIVHRHKELLSVWQRGWAMYLAAAAGFTALSLWLVQQAPNPFAVDPSIKLSCAATYTLAMWAWVCGLIGAALRFFSAESAARRYLADASYWMYLAHLPIVFALQLLVLDWPLHWSVKFVGIVTVTVAILLLSYHIVVRRTIIGQVLNGRRRVSSTKNVGLTLDDPTGTSSTSRTRGAIVARMHDVRKRYGNTAALDGVDLQIRSGEVLALLGPNGAGKSTAISLLLGLQGPDSGAIAVFGESPDCAEAIEARRQLGVMLQDVALPPEARVRELIQLTSSYYAAPLALDDVLAMTHTTSLADRPYAKLSGGQQRLVQFALAVCGRPKLLFLDEPTTGLDIQAREVLWNTIRELVKEGCSVVLTTHYLEEAEALADRIAVLSKGRIVATGTVCEVRALVARKVIRCISSLSAEQIRCWPDVVDVAQQGRRLSISTIDAESVARHLLTSDHQLRELEVSRVSLAEAFVELTEEAA